jgi:MGT family glycosyltransferase
MTNFLFTLWDGGGASPPVLEVAGALVKRGHDVRVIADPVLADEVADAGARHVHWKRAPHRTVRTPESDLVKDWTFKTPIGAFNSMVDNLLFGPLGDFVADVQEELAKEPADVVVSEMVMLGGTVAAEAAGIPSAALVSTIYPLPAKGVPPFGAGMKPARGPLGRARDAALLAVMSRTWQRGRPALNATRAANGLEPLDQALDQLTRADKVLVLTSETFDFVSPELPPNVQYVGPRIADPVWTGEGWTPPPGDDPLVLVGLSSTYMDQLGVLRRIAEALGSLPVRGVITTGPLIDPADIAAPPNVQVLRTAPHREVLEHAAVAITHCGHGTAMKALAHGVPMVCVPMGRDQLDVATRVVTRGAGVKVSPKAKPTKLAAAVQQVLAEPGYRAGAQRLQAAIAAETAHDRAVEELEALANSGSVAKPLLA